MKSDNVLISIIVPVYDMEKYIHRCMDSLINQTYKNIEIIMVNDGSKDKSLDIIKEYAEKDNRIRYVDQENGGPGCARNSGLDIAKGDYIGFVDCDDYVVPEMYERLYEDCIGNDAEIAVCDIYTDQDQESDNSKAQRTVLQFDEFYPQLINDKITSHLANKLFKKSLFVDGTEKARFKLGNSVDYMFLMPVLFRNAKKVVIDEAKLYMHFINRTDFVSNSKKNVGINAYQSFTAFRDRIRICKEYRYSSDGCLKSAVSFGIGAYGALDYKTQSNECKDIRAYFRENREKINSDKEIDSFRKNAVKLICDVPNIYMSLKSIWGEHQESSGEIEKDKISVIVPVWNGHDYLEMCLQSIIHQTYQNLEIILVDDGSTDDSLEICERFASMDQRIIVYHKENGGQASARNYGLDRCTGDFIGFVDDDDWILPSMYERLHKLIVEHNADVSRCCDISDLSEINVEEQSSTTVTPKDEIHHLLFCDILGGHVTDRLFKSNTIGDARFPHSKTIEDMRFMRKILGRIEKEVVTSSKLFFYTVREDNTSFVYAKNHVNSYERAEEYQGRYYEAKDKYPQYMEELLLKSTTFACGTMKILIKQHGKRSREYRKMKAFLHENKASILRLNSLGIRYKVFVALL